MWLSLVGVCVYVRERGKKPEIVHVSLSICVPVCLNFSSGLGSWSSSSSEPAQRGWRPFQAPHRNPPGFSLKLHCSPPRWVRTDLQECKFWISRGPRFFHEIPLCLLEWAQWHQTEASFRRAPRPPQSRHAPGSWGHHGNSDLHLSQMCLSGFSGQRKSGVCVCWVLRRICQIQRQIDLWWMTLSCLFWPKEDRVKQLASRSNSLLYTATVFNFWSQDIFILLKIINKSTEL